MEPQGKPDEAGDRQAQLGQAQLGQAQLGDVLARVADELGHVSGLLGHVETLVGPLILEAARPDAHLLRQMQDLDHIRQKVQALGSFLEALALASPDHLVDAGGAARLVTLADLAARLTLSGNANASNGADWGDCELF